MMKNRSVRPELRRAIRRPARTPCCIYERCGGEEYHVVTRDWPLDHGQPDQRFWYSRGSCAWSASSSWRPATSLRSRTPTSGSRRLITRRTPSPNRRGGLWRRAALRPMSRRMETPGCGRANGLSAAPDGQRPYRPSELPLEALCEQQSQGLLLSDPPISSTPKSRATFERLSGGGDAPPASALKEGGRNGSRMVVLGRWGDCAAVRGRW